MTHNDGKPEQSLAERIEALRRAATPPGKRLPSDAAVATAIAARAGASLVDENTLYRLRTGRTVNPSMKVLKALADHFQVSPGFFFPGSVWGPEEHLALADALRSPQVRRLCMRLGRLSSEELAQVDRLLPDDGT
ncbi:helix-turn-helix domain-containing protein [Kitasatospora sp. NPDC057542]|uniref:helix-turn-helix domain-containing protein n=1 Tax=Kitasatospora sp. NPDC057542 TaxID=3346162 RepID=UPI0036B3816F